MNAAPRVPLILASASAVRRKLLTAAGIEVAIVPAALDESLIKHRFCAGGGSVEDCAAALAEAKALSVARRHPGALVIGADQMLEFDGDWLDKPRDLAAACAQLVRLRGRSHALVCGVAVASGDEILWRHVARARLAMRAFSDAFLADYAAAMGERLLATVGGYELEGLGAQLFQWVDGDFFSILGLPLLPLLDFLRQRGGVAR